MTPILGVSPWTAYVLRRFLADVHGGAAAGSRAELAREVKLLLEKLELLRLQLRVAPQHLQELLGIELHHRDARDAVAVGAHLGHVLRDINIHPVDHRHHRDQRGGGEDDARAGSENCAVCCRAAIEPRPLPPPKTTRGASKLDLYRLLPVPIHCMIASSTQKRSGERARNPRWPP